MTKLFNRHAGLSDLSTYDFDRSLEGHKKAFEKRDDISEDQLVDTEGNYTDDFVEQMSIADAEKVGEVLHAFSTGRMRDRSIIKDVLHTYDYPEIFYSATEILLKSRIYPEAIVTNNLFQSIPYSGEATQLTIRTLGGVRVEEVAEGGEYPETSTAVNDQAYRIHLEIKKYGAKVAGTRDLIQSDNWGIFAATIAQLGDEIAMLREKMAITKLNTEAGFVIMDNLDASSAELGTPTGRGWTGAQNGALGVEDIFEVFAFMNMRGYNLDTILVHPFQWMMWTRDPEIREGVLGDNVIFTPSGSAAPGWGQPFGPYGLDYSKYGSTIGANAGTTGTPDSMYGKLGVGSSQTFPEITPMGATFQTTPRYAPAMKIIVSPFVPFYKIAGLSTNTALNGKYATNLIFADSKRCGLILEKESPVMDQWSDIEREINFVKIRTKFGMAFMEQGRAVCTAKNVVIDKTIAFDTVRSLTSVAAIDRTTNILT